MSIIFIFPNRKWDFQPFFRFTGGRSDRQTDYTTTPSRSHVRGVVVFLRVCAKNVCGWTAFFSRATKQRGNSGKSTKKRRRRFDSKSPPYVVYRDRCAGSTYDQSVNSFPFSVSEIEFSAVLPVRRARSRHTVGRPR